LRDESNDLFELLERLRGDDSKVTSDM